MVILIALLTFASITLAVTYLARPRPDYVRQRLMHGATANEIARERVLRGGPIQRLVLPSVRRFSAFLASALPQNIVKNVEKQLIMANQPMTLGAFLFIWFTVVAIACLVVLAIIRTNPDIAVTRFAVLAGLIIGLAVLIPYALIRRRARSRARAIQRTLPDALDLLVTSVEAGLGVDAAFALVAERSSGPLAEVFNEYLRQVGLGRPRRDALENVAERSGAEDLIRLATTVSQATEVGTTMGDVLRIQAKELRTARRLRAQEAAQKAPVWMVIPLVFCFVPAMFAVIVIPSILNLLKFIEDLGS
jgi:tight adherence protein C